MSAFKFWPLKSNSNRPPRPKAGEGNLFLDENGKLKVRLSNDTDVFVGTGGLLDATEAGRDLLTAEDAAAQNNLLWEAKTGAFTASPGGRYVCTGTFSVTNPAGGNNGEMFQVVVASGTVTVNGVAYAASRWTVTVVRVSGTWTTISNNLTENLTLNGTANTAPNQTASSGSSLITRDLLDVRTILRDVRSALVLPAEFAYTTSGTGATFLGTRFVDLRTGNTAGSLCAARAPGTGQSCYFNSQTNDQEINFGATVGFSFRLQCFDLSTDAVLRCYLGRTVSSTSNGDPTSRCIGIKIVGRRIWLEAHNGTTLTSNDTGVDIPNVPGAVQSMSILSNGSGTVELYVSGSITATISGGPTAGTGVSAGGIWFAVDNPSTNGASYAIQQVTVGYK